MLRLVAAPSTQETSNYFGGILERLPDSHGRLAFCLLLAALPLFVVFGKSSAGAKVIAGISTIGLFWWGWVLTNTFGKPTDGHGHALNNESLFGPGAPSTIGDLFSGTDILLLAVAIIAGVVAWKRISGFLGFLSGFGIFTGILIVVSIWKALH